MSDTKFSYRRQTWKRLKRNTGAMIGLSIIILSSLLALFGYFFATDFSPNANRIILETGGRKPGFSHSFLLVKMELGKPKANFFTRLLYGVEDTYQYLPIVNHRIEKDSIFVDKYIDEGLSEKQSYALSKVAAQPIIQKTFFLGSDKFGRDIYSRLIIGTRVSLSVGLVVVLISLTVGLLLGSLAGYYRGKVDEAIMWFINVIWSIPTLLLVFALTLVLGRGFWQVFIAIGLSMWVNVARLVRGQILVVREMEYVEAGKALGFSHLRIIVKHIWPNIMGPVLVIASANFASAIVIEAGLSFLGVGVQPPMPSWGLMIKENYNFIITQNPMLALAPGFAIMLLVLAFSLLGNGLRDALEVRTEV